MALSRKLEDRVRVKNKQVSVIGRGYLWASGVELVQVSVVLPPGSEREIWPA